MSLAQSIRSSTQWLLAGNLGSQVLHFAFGIILARLLVPEDFGLLVTVQIFTGVAGLIAGGGMGQALIRSKDATEHDFNVVFTMQFIVCTIIFCFFYTIAPYFAEWYNEPIYESLLRITAVNFLLRPLIGNHGAWLHRNMRFKVRAVIGFTSGLITSISSVYMAWLGMGVWSLALSGILGGLVNWLLLSRQTPLHITFAFSKAAASELGGTGVRFSLLDIVSYIRRQANNFILGTAVGPSAVGLFNKADSLAQLPFSTLSAAVYEPVFRTLSQEQNDLDKSKYIFFRTSTLLFAYSIPAYLVFSWLAEPLIIVVYGAHWQGAAAPLSILVWLWVLSCFNHPAGALLAAQNRLNQELGQQVTTLVLNVAGCLIGLRWGLSGVAWALLAVGVISHAYMMLLVKQCIRIEFADFARALTPGLILGTITFTALGLVWLLTPSNFAQQNQAIYLAVSLVVSGAAYTSALLWLPIREIETESQRWRKAFRLGK